MLKAAYFPTQDSKDVRLTDFLVDLSPAKFPGWQLKDPYVRHD